MARMINAEVVKKILGPHRVHSSLISTPGLDLITRKLMEAIGNVNFSIHEEQMIKRALELAWLEGASVIAATTDSTVLLNHRLPV